MPKKVDLSLYAGDTALYYNGEAVDAFVLTGVDVEVGQLTAQLRTEGGELLGELDLAPEALGRVEVGIEAGLSQTLGGYPRVRWDLQQTYDDSTVVTHMAGVINMTQDVSRLDL